MADLHSDWAPSAMARILSCPGSVELSKNYPQEDSEASILGTEAHRILENCLTFGLEPDHEDIEIVEGVQLALDYVETLSYEQIHIEHRLSIPNTPVWGTTDIVCVNDTTIEIVDFKFGYLPVNVVENKQMLAYLVGAIAEFGPRPKYKLTVIQPRYDHVDGPVRSWGCELADLADFHLELQYALDEPDRFEAGNHCKYCPAAGECKVLAGYIAERGSKAMEYDFTGKMTFSDTTMSQLLDFADLVQGWAKELRSAAYRRAMNDRILGGWKMVRGRKSREFASEQAIVAAYQDLGIPVEALYESSLVGPATVEKHIKGLHKGKRNAWKEPWERIARAIKETEGSPSLVRASDGRELYYKGMEFSELPSQAEGDLIV